MNENLKYLIEEYKNKECTFLEMENAFADVTGDEILNSNSVEDLLNNSCASFEYNESEWANVIFDIVEENEDPLQTIIKITDVYDI